MDHMYYICCWVLLCFRDSLISKLSRRSSRNIPNGLFTLASIAGSRTCKIDLIPLKPQRTVVSIICSDELIMIMWWPKCRGYKECCMYAYLYARYYSVITLTAPAWVTSGRREQWSLLTTRCTAPWDWWCWTVCQCRSHYWHSTQGGYWM